MPSNVLLIIASSEDSTMATSRAGSSSARKCCTFSALLGSILLLEASKSGERLRSRGIAVIVLHGVHEAVRVRIASALIEQIFNTLNACSEVCRGLKHLRTWPTH